jgi:hypothetical protein
LVVSASERRRIRQLERSILELDRALFGDELTDLTSQIPADAVLNKRILEM